MSGYYYKVTSQEEKEEIHNELNANWPELCSHYGYLCRIDRDCIYYSQYRRGVYWTYEYSVSDCQPVSLDEFFTLIKLSEI